MKKYFQFALLSFYENFLINLLMVFEVLIVIVGVNIIIASYNNRNMLYQPYEAVLNDNVGWYVSSEIDENTGKPIVDEMKGDLEIIQINYFNDNIIVENGYIPINIIICPDEILDNLKMPVHSGLWKTKSSGKNAVCIAAANSFGISAGSTIKAPMLNDTSLKVSGILTDPCYLPSFNNWKRMGDIENFYRRYSIKYYDRKSEESETLNLIMCQSEFDKLNDSESDSITNSHSSKIVYDKNPTAENIEYNEKLLQNNYQCGVTFSDIVKRTNMSLNNVLKKYIPLALCAFIVILLGLISCTSINTLRQMKNYGIFFICGMNWKDCRKICLAYTSITIACSLILTAAILTISKVFNISAYLGLSFQFNNLIATILLVFILLAFNIIIPFSIIRNKMPVEILKENN